jgi:archaellum component FlaC
MWNRELREEVERLNKRLKSVETNYEYLLNRYLALCEFLEVEYQSRGRFVEKTKVG